MASADELKALGNKAIAEKNFDEAVAKFTEAIKLQPDNHDPQLIQKLAANPKTASFLADPAFMAKLQQMKENPKGSPDLFTDPRMLQVLGVLMGVDMQMGMPDDMPQDAEMRDAPPPPEPKPAPKKAPTPEPDDKAIEACTKAVEEGREIYADFKLIAKSYARIGTAYEKQGNLELAIENYKKSLTEHRTPDVNAKLRAAERNKIEQARLAYIDPTKAEEAREEGNKKFKESDWPGAIAAYSEMIKRAPDDPRGYSNRAAAFVKLLEFPSAVEDCNTAIKKDPTFIRAYIRKAQAFHGMREYSKAVDACTEAAKVDQEHHKSANAREIEQQQQKAFNAMYATRENETEEQTKERLARDPEIMSIMNDPIMQSILQQAQTDPAALTEHMKNPDIRTKVQKLVAAGVIRVGR
ncbi:TPR-like protein [Colletotrichum sublineola]|nr:TPR-like protein [Colletotrichum sublineola]